MARLPTVFSFLFLRKGNLAATTTTTTRTAKKQQIKLAKQHWILYVHHAFLYISLPSLHDHDVKRPKFKFSGGLEHKTTIFWFFLKLRNVTVLKNSSPEKCTNIWQIEREGNWGAMNFRNSVNSHFSFHCRRRPCLRSLKLESVPRPSSRLSFSWVKPTWSPRQSQREGNSSLGLAFFWSVFFFPSFFNTYYLKRHRRNECAVTNSSVQESVCETTFIADLIKAHNFT